MIYSDTTTFQQALEITVAILRRLISFYYTLAVTFMVQKEDVRHSRCKTPSSHLCFYIRIHYIFQNAVLSLQDRPFLLILGVMLE
jgi:hypothetical protein